MCTSFFIFCISVTSTQCGKGIASCPSGMCCSYWGFCGTSEDYCGSKSTQCLCDCNGKNPCFNTYSCTTMYVTAISLNIRIGPSTNYSSNGLLSQGDSVCVVSISNNWARLDTGNFVSSKYLSSSQPCTTMFVTATSLNIRTGPGTNYSKSGILVTGDSVCVVSKSNGWAKLDSGNYVSTDYLSFSQPTPSKPSEPSDPSPSIPVEHPKIRNALLTSDWKGKADSLTVAYDVAIGNGYSINAAIGLMANLYHEGNYGVVEYAFSTSHNFGFYLPSGSKNGKAKTIADIKYVRDWTTVSEKINNLNKGSCGFGSIQWSFERRVTFAKVCLEIMKKDSDVTDTNYAIAEAKFISQELKNKYYKDVSNAAKKAGGSVEAWAEAFTDYYEKPKGSDGNMSGVGSACRTRRATARALYQYLLLKDAF